MHTPPKREAIDFAMANNATLLITYRDDDGTTSEREVEPLAWLESDCILAFCFLENGQRFFRLDRILTGTLVPMEGEWPDFAYRTLGSNEDATGYHSCERDPQEA